MTDSTAQPIQDSQADNAAELEQELTQASQVTKQAIQQDPATANQLATTAPLQGIVVDVEKDLLSEIIKRLEKNEMSTEKAQQVAKEFLSLLPVHDKKDLLEKLYKLSQANSEAKGIYVKYAKPHEEEEAQKKIELMSRHLHEGNIEQALIVAKGGLPNERNNAS